MIKKCIYASRCVEVLVEVFLDDSVGVYVCVRIRVCVFMFVYVMFKYIPKICVYLYDKGVC